MTERRIQRTASGEDNGTAGGGPEELRFRSGDAECAATLYRPRPAAAGDVPCVVMVNGVSQTRRDGFPRFAERFAEAGFAALTFDPRHLGDSGGEPRQLVDIARERDDVAAAVAFARTLDGIDAGRVAVWGFSLGGGLALYTAAADERIVATVVLCPWVDGLAFQLAAGARDNARLMAAASGALLGRRLIRMPVAGAPGELALFTQPEAKAGFDAVRGHDSRWRNELRGKPWQPAGRFRPIRVARRVRCPLFVGLGTRDTIVPLRPIERVADRAPRAELHRYAIGHFDALLDAFEDVVEDQVAFLTRHLVPDTTG